MPGTMFTASKAFLAPLFMISLSVITSIAAGVSKSKRAMRFAVTLMIGIAVSMFTAIVVTKTLMKWAVNMGMLKSNWQFRVKRG